MSQYLSQVCSLTLKVALFPIQQIYSSYSNKSRLNNSKPVQKYTKPGQFPGIYIVKYSDQSIKIGRSKHIHTRLKGYKGYQQYGQDIEILMLIYTEQHRILEKMIHKFAQDVNLTRMGQLEIFMCAQQDTFLRQLTAYLQTIQISHHIVDKQHYMEFLSKSPKQLHFQPEPQVNRDKASEVLIIDGYAYNISQSATTGSRIKHKTQQNKYTNKGQRSKDQRLPLSNLKEEASSFMRLDDISQDQQLVDINDQKWQVID